MSASTYFGAGKKYEVVKLLGEGSYGQVTLVSRRNGGKLMAVKTMAHNNGADEKIVQMMKRESLIQQIASDERHANVLRLYRTKEDETNYYLFLEYAAGGCLMDRIEDGEGLPAEKAQFFFKQLIEGLSFLHGLGIVHRDIKTENLLLTHDEVLKIADFGLAAVYKCDEEEIMLDMICGTAACMAPEMLAQELYEAEPVDVWSAGITLVEMLTGVEPWQAAKEDSKSYQKWVAKTCLDEDPWVRVEDNVLDLIKRMLEKEPRRRAKFAEIKNHQWFSYQYGKN